MVLTSSTSPFTSSPSSSSLFSPCCSCCLTTSTSLISWIIPLCISAGDLGTLAENKSSTQGTSRVPIRCWNLSVHDRATLRHCLQHEGNHERGSWTDHSLKDKVEANRALPQRTPAMCVELPLGGNAGRRHPCDGGCRLGWKPKDKVLNVWRSTGNWPVLHSTSLVSDTGNTITVLSRVRGQGDHESLHSSSVSETFAPAPDGTNVQNRSLDGQQQRQGHHTTSWTRAQSETLGGADDVGSTVEQARSHRQT